MIEDTLIIEPEMPIEEPAPSQNEGDIKADEVTHQVTDDAVEEKSPDYAAIVEADLAELRERFPELRGLKDIGALKNPIRFAALRDMGLSATEAFLATEGVRRGYDNRSHLTGSIPGGAGIHSQMPRADFDMARELFSDVSDAEIRNLYRRVTK